MILELPDMVSEGGRVVRRVRSQAMQIAARGRMTTPACRRCTARPLC